MATVRNFRDLRVYQAARASAKAIFELTKRFPRDEKFSLTDQIRRASRSIGANISEAWRKRRYRAAFINKLSDADAETAEVQAWLDHAFDCNYIDATVHKELDDRFDHIGAQLRLMMEQPEKWCEPVTRAQKPANRH